MGTLGPAELLVILLVALLVLGPERLPDAARKVGQVIGEVRRIGAGFQAELRDAMNTPANDATTAASAPAPLASPAPGAATASDSNLDVSPPPPARPDAVDLP